MTFMPRDVAEKIRAIGPVIDPPATAAVYAPLQEKEPYSGVKLTRDIKYGTDARQALDLFVPEAPGSARPVFIFIHGGGYTGGSKHEPGSPFYDNIMLWAARNGIVGVNATYRLAPAHPWPAGAEDVAGSVRWVLGNIAAHGGDPKRVFLCGHSAGGTHVASYAVMPQFHRVDGSGLKGLILISGNYDLTTVKAPDDRYKSYFGDDLSKYGERSPFTGLLKLPVPLMLAYAELDPPSIAAQSERLEAALRDAKRKFRSIKLKGHSHISITYAINTTDTELSDAMLEFIKSVG